MLHWTTLTPKRGDARYVELSTESPHPDAHPAFSPHHLLGLLVHPAPMVYLDTGRRQTRAQRRLNFVGRFDNSLHDLDSRPLNRQHDGGEARTWRTPSNDETSTHDGEQPMTKASPQMTVEQARNLPPVVDVPTAAAILGIGRAAAYELIRIGQWPTPILRVGKLIRVPSAPLLELVGVSR